jgi:hypothetical protein
MGLVVGASRVFFAFIGFDVVAHHRRRGRSNAQRDLPRASSARWPSARCSTCGLASSSPALVKYTIIT